MKTLFALLCVALLGSSLYGQQGKRWLLHEADRPMDWYGAMDYCLNMGGRLLSAGEMKRVYKTDARNAFKPNSQYWSGTPTNDMNEGAYYLRTDTGAVLWEYKMKRYRVMCTK